MQQQDQPGAIDPLDRMRRMGAKEIDCGPAKRRRLCTPAVEEALGVGDSPPPAVGAHHRGTGNRAKTCDAFSPGPWYAVRKRFLVNGGSLERAVLRRALRDHGETLDDEGRCALQGAEARLSDVARRSTRPQPLDVVRGLEGEAGQVYFGVFDHLIRTQKDAFRFAGRSRRPPLDAVNALLSFLYTLLVHDCRAALETVGLDPAVGFLHRDRPGRPSLALDLMEEFRAMLADRLALSLINRRQLGMSDFRLMENGAVLLEDEARKTVLVAYQERKREEIAHAFLQEQAPIGMLPHLQAQLLARHLRGDLDGYPPFVWK